MGAPGRRSGGRSMPTNVTDGMADGWHFVPAGVERGTGSNIRAVHRDNLEWAAEGQRGRGRKEF